MFQEGKIDYPLPHIPTLMKKDVNYEAKKSYMFFYEKELVQALPMCSLCAGCDYLFVRLEKNSISSLTLFLSLKYWIVDLLGMRPFLEYSAFGPTLLFKTPEELSSPYLFQNFYSIGLQVGRYGPTVRMTIIHLLQGNVYKPTGGISIPSSLSLSLSF